MTDKIKVYIEKDALEKIILNLGSFKNLLAIISEHSILHLNLTEEEINKEWNSTSLEGQRGGSKIHKFCTGHSMRKPLSACTVFKEFQNDENKFLNYSRSLFILDITKEEAKRLREQYGVMILSNEGITDDFFQFHIKDSVKKNEVKDGYADGWDYFFDIRRHSWLPSNALVFSDEYLFKNEDGGKNLGIRNVKSLIKHLLPKDLGTVFQILIVSPIPRNSIDKAKTISKELTDFVHNLSLPYQCEITFVFTDSIHTRKAFSNYYVMTCDKGFCVYKNKQTNIVNDTNFVDITSVFHSAADIVGTTGYDDTTMCIKDIKKICEDARTQFQAGIKTVFISGDCGPNFEIKNRLFE